MLLKSFSDGAYKTGLSDIGTYGCLAVDGEQVFRTHLATFFFFEVSVFTFYIACMWHTVFSLFLGIRQ